MPVAVALTGVAVLLGAGPLSVALQKLPGVSRFVYLVCLAACLAAMNLVVLADDAFAFLVAWEFMSLTSWALVMAYHRDPENRRAGFIYIVMASFGTLTLLLAFGLLAGSGGGYAFSEIRGAGAALPGAIFLLVLIGAGSKAGLVP